MRIDREEKKSLKKLFICILVMALLVTLVPYGDMGNIVVRAADETTQNVYTTEDLQGVSFLKAARVYTIQPGEMKLEDAQKAYPELVFETEVESGVVLPEQVFYMLVEYARDNSQPVIIELNTDLDFKNFSELGNYIRVSGANIGINMNKCNILNIDLQFYRPAEYSLNEITQAANKTQRIYGSISMPAVLFMRQNLTVVTTISERSTQSHANAIS